MAPRLLLDYGKSIGSYYQPAEKAGRPWPGFSKHVQAPHRESEHWLRSLGPPAPRGPESWLVADSSSPPVLVGEEKGGLGLAH